jgi:hypothetical protein
MAESLAGYAFTFQSAPASKHGTLWYRDGRDRLTRAYFRLAWPSFTLCDDADDDDGRQVS